MKVFIIDDDHLSIFVTQHQLVFDKRIKEINPFLSATEALKALHTASSTNIPEIIFLDLDMPEINGWQFLDALAPLEPKLNKRCAIYILTSSLDISDTIRMRDYPMVLGLIHKPLKKEDVDFIMSQILILDSSISI